MRAVLALGANTGDRAGNLRAALARLDALDGLAVEAVSTFLETAPVGTVPDQPDFLNAVALVRTTLDPHALLRACHAVEAAVGLDRAAKVPDGPRPIDVDLITCGDLVLTGDETGAEAGGEAGGEAGDGLVLPHPRARERAFVLGPWLELDPDAVLPGPRGGRVADLLAQVAP